MDGFEELAALACDSLAPAGHASDPDYVVARTIEDVERLCDEISDERDYPIVGLTLRRDSHEPVLRASDIRGVVGPGVRIYLLSSETLLSSLQEMLGSRLRLLAGAVRVWWPDAAGRCDPGDNPSVIGLDDEDYLVTLEEFAREFDLSRPRVRERVRLIEDTRAFLERELANTQEQSRKIHEHLRDTQVECHELRGMLAFAEARLEAILRLPEPE